MLSGSPEEAAVGRAEVVAVRVDDQRRFSKIFTASSQVGCVDKALGELLSKRCARWCQGHFNFF